MQKCVWCGRRFYARLPDASPSELCGRCAFCWHRAFHCYPPVNGFYLEFSDAVHSFGLEQRELFLDGFYQILLFTEMSGRY